MVKFRGHYRVLLTIHSYFVKSEAAEKTEKQKTENDSLVHAAYRPARSIIIYCWHEVPFLSRHFIIPCCINRYDSEKRSGKANERSSPCKKNVIARVGASSADVTFLVRPCVR